MDSLKFAKSAAVLLSVAILLVPTYATAQPANDTCPNAAILTLTPNVPQAFSVDNTNATNDPFDTCTFTTTAATAGIWWRYDATQQGRLHVDETSAQDIVSVYWEMNTAGAACPASMANSTCPTAESFYITMQAGKTYYLLMHSNSVAPPTVGVSGTFTFATAPSNDTCAGAVVLNLPPGVAVNFNTDFSAATTDVGFSMTGCAGQTQGFSG